MTPLPFRLLIISDRSLCPDLLVTLETALAGIPPDSVAVMLREKDLPGTPLLQLARRLRDLTRSVGARLILNDRLDVALACDADGVHLPAAGLPVERVREAAGLPPSFLVGRSTHSVEEVLAAEAARADYVTFGPIFATPSKAAYGEPLGLSGLRAARAASELPIIGLGGIDLERAPAVMAAGASGVAGIRVVLGADDPAGLVTGLLRATASG